MHLSPGFQARLTRLLLTGPHKRGGSSADETEKIILTDAIWRSTSCRENKKERRSFSLCLLDKKKKKQWLEFKTIYWAVNLQMFFHGVNLSNNRFGFFFGNQNGKKAILQNKYLMTIKKDNKGFTNQRRFYYYKAMYSRFEEYECCSF